MGRQAMRLLLGAGLATALLAGAGVGEDAAGPTTRPGRHTWTGVRRIVAVGDIHGDCDQFDKALRAAKVIDADGDWAAGKTHLVQTGDVLDRGPDSRKAMDLLMKLQRQAAAAGGAVHVLIGNHEAMVLLGDWRYVHPGEIKAFGGRAAYRRAMGPKGKYGRWLRTLNTAIRINDVLFCHAGLTPSYADRSLDAINKAVRDELAREFDDTGIVASPGGPLWTRELALGATADVARALDAVLAKYGARHMVIAHTVARSGVVTRAGGRLIRIDVGMSAYYGGPAACLVIEDGAFYEVRPDGRRRLDVKAARTRPAATRPSAPARRAG